MDAIPLRLSLVVPAYNEAAVIETAVREADDTLGKLFVEYEIVVVDDGSRDGTAEIVEGLAGEFPRLRLVRHPANRGYGAALRSGFEAAAFGLVAFTDADCQFDLLDLGRMVPLTDRYPVVVGYRATRRDPWRRRFLSWGYNRLSRTLLGTGVRDCDCALKVFRLEALADLLPASRGFFVNTEMLTRARRLGYAVAEVPVTHRPRLGGESKVSLREVPRTLRTLLGFWWREVAFGPPVSAAPVVLAGRVRGSSFGPAGKDSVAASGRRGYRQASPIDLLG
ncbi:MAG TPA: glycosyltransferase family 2 protein [Fimbriiglobus sp.]|nr:glycosyltransferase family 2 protein [Fimbriiglobus sp.]